MDEQKFIDFVVALAKLFPPQLVEVDIVQVYAYDDDNRRVPACIVRMESRYTQRIDIRQECATELQAQVLAIKVRRAVDAVSTFGL